MIEELMIFLHLFWSLARASQDAFASRLELSPGLHFLLMFWLTSCSFSLLSRPIRQSVHYLSPGSLCCQPKERCPPKAMVLVRKTGFPGLFDGPPGHGERSPETNPRVQIGHATLFWDWCSVELSNEIVWVNIGLPGHQKSGVLTIFLLRAWPNALGEQCGFWKLWNMRCFLLNLVAVKAKVRKRTARKRKIINLYLLRVYLKAAGMLPNKNLAKH